VGAAQAWTAALWRRLETLLVAEMGAVCAKVYTLERVLRLKNDGATGVNFLDEALSVSTVWLGEGGGRSKRERERG
jgi:hypothetical protein